MSSSVRILPRPRDRRTGPRCFGIAICLAALGIPLGVSAQGTYTLEAAAVAAPSGGTATIPVTMDAPGDTRGFSFSLCNADPEVVPFAVDPGSAVDTIYGGQPPQLFLASLTPESATISAIYSNGGPIITLAAGNDLEIAVFHYTVEAGQSAGASFPLEFCFAGTPAIDIVVIGVPGVSIIPTTTDGSITVSGSLSSTSFIRGDINQDGAVGVTDGIVLLGELFGLVPPGSCPRSGDVNVNGTRDIADVVSLLHGVLGNGSPIPAPYPACGVSPATSTLACQPTAVCP